MAIRTNSAPLAADAAPQLELLGEFPIDAAQSIETVHDEVGDGRLDGPRAPSSSGAPSRKIQQAERRLPRLAVKPDEAAEMLGTSRDYFDEHIKPELRIVRRGSKTILIPVGELQRWLDKSATRFRH